MLGPDRHRDRPGRIRRRWSRRVLWRRTVRQVRRGFIGGLLLLVPVAFTYSVFKFIFDTMDGLLKPALEAIFDKPPPGLGAAIVAVFVFLAGLFVANALGRRVVGWGQAALLRIPLIGVVYGASKQLIESFTGTGQTGFKRVVMLEYPRERAWTIGFLTSITADKDGRQLALVYIPTAPTPNSGWVAVLPLEDVYDTDLTVQQAIQLVLSGGIISPERIVTRRIQTSGAQGSGALE